MRINIENFANQYLSDLRDVLDRFNYAPFEKIIGLLLDAYEKGNTIFVMGNGGSGSTASHFACDINKGCCLDLEKKFRVMCLNDSLPTLLALANDVSYESIFVEQMKNFFSPGDVVMGISGSGNSENVIAAITYAKRMGGRTVGLSGFSGGKLSQVADISFIAEAEDMQKVEDVHMIVIHMMMQAIYKTLHGTAEMIC